MKYVLWLVAAMACTVGYAQTSKASLEKQRVQSVGRVGPGTGQEQAQPRESLKRAGGGQGEVQVKAGRFSRTGFRPRSGKTHGGELHGTCCAEHAGNAVHFR